ncbi:hypothetical protein A2U01_0073827, partial [Trifolium medium]|nr:hypothetical protein [Trifolium medium]
MKAAAQLKGGGAANLDKEKEKIDAGASFWE